MLKKSMRSDPAAPRHRPFSSPWLLWIVWIVWLPFLVPSVVLLLRGPLPAAALVVLAAIAVFVFAYAFFTFRVALALSGRAADGNDERTVDLGRTGVVILLLALSVAIELLGTRGSLEMASPFVFTSAYAGTAFRTRRAALTNAAVLGLCLAAEIAAGTTIPGLLQSVFLIAVVGFMTMNWARSIVTSVKLHDAQAEIARLAATEERLRIARDLHDLLGQKLSYMALKSELARHLVASAPGKAEAEIADVESTIRSTLHEVREAVAGYRAPDLPRELRAAQEILSAAGIELVNRCPQQLIDRLSPPASRALAWAVREGVTNVIRHSRAKTCVIETREEDGCTVIEVQDDGIGAAAGRSRPRRQRGKRVERAARAVPGAGGTMRSPRAGPGRLHADGSGPRPEAGMIRVLLADDQATVRGALAALLRLEKDMEIVAEVGRAVEVLPAAIEKRADVALLDIEMPGRGRPGSSR